jgi:hypothetical protein
MGSKINIYTTMDSCETQQVTNRDLSYSKADWYGLCIHLRILNIRHFKVVEAMGLKVMASRSPSMA